MERLRLPLLALLLLSPVACVSSRVSAPLETAAQVDLKRYAGRWFEIASFPQKFQKGCTGTTATYTEQGDGTFEVVNRCYEGKLNGPEKLVRGTARVAEDGQNSKLEVRFVWPFWADYWILEVASDYSYAVVGHPTRKYLWILSRQPELDAAIYAGIVERLKAKDYDTSLLQRTLQATPTS